jgi:hypothetical protein
MCERFVFDGMAEAKPGGYAMWENGMFCSLELVKMSNK